MSDRTATDLKTQEDNPQGWSYHPELNPSQQDYDKQFNAITSTPDNQALNDQGDAIARDHATGRDADSSRQAVQDGEKKAAGDTVTRAAVAASGVNPVLGTAVKVLARLKTRGGATGAVAGILIVVLLAGGGILAGSLAPIAFFTNVIDDLNDQVTALDVRQDKMTRTKLANVERDASLKGCTTLSIRCKFKSLSTTQVENFKKYDIEVKGKTIAGRMFPETYSYKGGDALSPREFADLLKTNELARVDFKAAVNMRYLGFKDFVYKRWTMSRFGISEAAAKLTGATEEERAKQLALGEASKAAQLPKFIPAGTDDNGNPRYTLEGDTGDPPRYYTAEEAATMKQQATAYLEGDVKPPSEMDPAGGVKTQFFKSLNIAGAWDLACTLKNEIGRSAVMAKYLRYVKYAKYIAPIAGLVFKIKAGDGTPEDAAAVGAFFTSTDGRAMITDVAGSFPASGTGSTIPDIGTLKQKANPYYGKNAMDSGPYKMSVNGGVAAPTEASVKHSLGMNASTALMAVGATAAAIDVVVNLGSRSGTACNIVQNWFVRGVGFIIGTITAIFSGGGSLAINLSIMGGIAAAFFAVNSIISSILNDEVVPDNITSLPEDRGAIAWTATSTLTAETARARGLMPASADDIVAYTGAGVQTRSDYAALDSRSVSPFDISSPYSTVSRLAVQIYDKLPTNTSLGSYIASAASLVSNATGRAITPSSSYAATIDPKRFKQCKDQNYEDMKIDADVQCNVRYVMPQKDLALDTDTVAKYMEDRGFVEPNTTTGLPVGYTIPSASGSSNFVTNLAKGFASSFYNDRASLYQNKYALFLDYCVYRTLPFGKTYDDPGAFGGAGEEWWSGKKCTDQNDPDMSNFRIYTLDKSVSDIAEPVESNALPSDSIPVVTSQEGWTFPVAINDWKGPFGSNVWGSCTVKCRHAGIDIGVGLDTPVLAAHDGKIIITNSTSSGYGGGYLIQATGTGVYYAYQHMNSAPLPAGTMVTAGQVIGKSGCTGNCFGPHLHFSIEKTAHISTYAEGAGKTDGQMPSWPPLCFLPMETRLFGEATTNNCAALGLTAPQ